MEEIYLTDCVGFDWDSGNQVKNQEKHNVSTGECEEIFFNQPLLLHEDVKHSKREQRFYALGKTNFEKRLFIAFTIRNNFIRIISARPMSKKERSTYEKTKEST